MWGPEHSTASVLHPMNGFIELTTISVYGQNSTAIIQEFALKCQQNHVSRLTFLQDVFQTNRQHFKESADVIGDESEAATGNPPVCGRDKGRRSSFLSSPTVPFAWDVHLPFFRLQSSAALLAGPL